MKGTPKAEGGGTTLPPPDPAAAEAEAPAEERDRIRRNLLVLQWAGVVGGVLGALSQLATANKPVALVLLVGSGLVGVSMWLRRLGWLQLSSATILILLVTTIHVLCTIGKGVNDTATMLYPVAILGAALMLDRGFLLAVTASCVASFAILAFQQSPGSPDWPGVFDVSLILAATAVTVDLLVRDVAGGAAAARSKERRLAQAYEKLEAQSAELERFTYVVSHDLKSPLVTIRGFLDYAEQAAREGDLARMEKDTERIRIASDRMAELLDDLLELSRTGRIERDPQVFPFGTVVDESRALVEGRLIPHGARLTVAEDAAGRLVRGDRPRLVQLMQNLLDNAAKFSAREATPEITVGLRQGTDGSDPVFTVHDNGVGIDPADGRDIFELFHQVDPSEEGTGLGLALGRRIVEEHGGRLWMESAGKGQGTTFCFTLPMEAPEPGEP